MLLGLPPAAGIPTTRCWFGDSRDSDVRLISVRTVLAGRACAWPSFTAGAESLVQQGLRAHMKFRRRYISQPARWLARWLHGVERCCSPCMHGNHRGSRQGVVTASRSESGGIACRRVLPEPAAQDDRPPAPSPAVAAIRCFLRLKGMSAAHSRIPLPVFRGPHSAVRPRCVC